MSKLVRDLIPDVLSDAQKANYNFTILDKNEYRTRLNEKLLEEAKEYIEAENIEELADLFEVVDAIIKLNGFKKEEIETVKNKKRETRGGFEKGILLEMKS